MPNTTTGNSPAKTYTLTDFISMKTQDELTYVNFGIADYKFGEMFIEETVLDYYLKELKALCVKIDSFTQEEINKYKYAPEILAYDIYGSTSLDFIILLCNGIIDPKEFDFKRGFLLLPKGGVLSEFLSKVYNSESEWLSISRKKNEPK